MKSNAGEMIKLFGGIWLILLVFAINGSAEKLQTAWETTNITLRQRFIDSFLAFPEWFAEMSGLIFVIALVVTMLGLILDTARD